MNDFLRSNSSRRAQKRAIDGILNGPSRPEGFNSRSVPARPMGRLPIREGVRGTNRRLDNFNRPEGYHVATRASGVVGTTAAPKLPKDTPANGSLLQNTLPRSKTFAKSRSHTRKRKPARPVRKWLFRGSLATLCLVLVIGGFLLVKGYIKLHKVFKGGGTAAALRSDVKPSLLKGEGDGRINILLMGKGGAGHDGGDLTDTLLLVSVDPVNKTSSLVSLPRDFWVTGSGGSSKVNAVYANAKSRALANNPKDKAGAQKAGVTQAEKTVSQVLGLPIHYYGMVDFYAFQQAIDTVGGVDINVPETASVTEHLWNETTGKNYYLNVGTGQQHFDGQRALFYARSRHTSPRGDFDRAERQRLLIAALTGKISSAGTFTNPLKVSQLMSAFGDHISTDMSVSDGLRLMKLVKHDKFNSVDLADPAHPLVTTGMISGQSIVQPTAGIGDYSEINSYVRNKLRDGYLAKEDAEVMVLNGTDLTGLAGKKAEELKSFGYKVGTVGDAPSQAYAKTIIVDRTNGRKKYTKHYLENRFGVKVTRSLPDTSIQPGQASFIIILGQDSQ